MPGRSWASLVSLQMDPIRLQKGDARWPHHSEPQLPLAATKLRKEQGIAAASVLPLKCHPWMVADVGAGKGELPHDYTDILLRFTNMQGHRNASVTCYTKQTFHAHSLVLNWMIKSNLYEVLCMAVNIKQMNWPTALWLERSLDSKNGGHLYLKESCE